MWTPQRGSQEAFLLTAEHVFEVLNSGTRGGGKSEALLADFVLYCDGRWGRAWKGLVLRPEYKALRELKERADVFIPSICPGARYSRAENTWHFPHGETLEFDHAQGAKHYGKYHGRQFAWLGWDDLTLWKDPDLYVQMFSVLRGKTPGIPRRCRATTNPGGLGHNWVKRRFIDQIDPGRIHREDGLTRMWLQSWFRENIALMRAEPDYEKRIRASAPNPHILRAWLYADWDIVAGGMFDDLFDRNVHVLRDFDPPEGWDIFRSYDHGTAKPFSVGWWGVADGESPIPDGRILPRGSLVLLHEWYGCQLGESNVGLRMAVSRIAEGIREREARHFPGRFVEAGPADPSIWTKDPDHPSTGATMQQYDAEFLPAPGGAGSRINGWNHMRTLLTESARQRPESRGLWVCARNTDWLRLVPTLPRDKRNPEDADTESEDHIADQTRYATSYLEAGPVYFDEMY